MKKSIKEAKGFWLSDFVNGAEKISTEEGFTFYLEEVFDDNFNVELTVAATVNLRKFCNFLRDQFGEGGRLPTIRDLAMAINYCNDTGVFELDYFSAWGAFIDKEENRQWLWREVDYYGPSADYDNIIIDPFSGAFKVKINLYRNEPIEEEEEEELSPEAEEFNRLNMEIGF